MQSNFKKPNQTKKHKKPQPPYYKGISKCLLTAKPAKHLLIWVCSGVITMVFTSIQHLIQAFECAPPNKSSCKERLLIHSCEMYINKEVLQVKETSVHSAITQFSSWSTPAAFRQSSVM